jgi:hypothetical protein
MSAKELAEKYIAAMEKTLENLQRTQGSVHVSEARVDEVLEYVRAYLKDAEYFNDHKEFETSLTSIAYCEGLLDALKLIEAVEVPSAG